jgi:glycosyltransferase involved in cell wall biosynthesis
VKAVGDLRRRGYRLSLVLAGVGQHRALRLLEAEIARTDPAGQFVHYLGHVEHGRVAELMANADLFVFPSACETMPNTLVEAMAANLPIACSNRGPMPEVLQDGGVYFDPDAPQSIATAITQIISDRPLRARIARRAKELSTAYSWERCANQTWDFVCATIAACENRR